MDLYADLPLAKGKGATADATTDGNNATSSVWAKGVASFIPGQRQAPPANATSVSMLPSSLAASRAKSPGSEGTAAKSGGRGISLAFRPASVARKAPASTTVRSNVFDANRAKPSEATVPAVAQDATPHVGLGFVAATTWTQVTVPKESTEDATESTPANDATTNTHFFQATYRDEYHPSRPNNYEAFCDERTAKKKLEQVKRELEERQREQERESKREREQFAKDVSEGKAPSIALPTSAGRGRGMTVPAWMKKKIEESASKAPHVPDTVMSGTTKDQFEDAPMRGGLGFSSTKSHEERPIRDEFGRDVSPRHSNRHHERDDRCGQLSRRSRSRSRDRLDPRRDGRPQCGRVILLQNMVGPGEVDEELEEEVKEECTTKYGPVEQCVVYEMRGRVSPEEAVRIFVQFRHQQHADQALQGLNSRFFGGRRVNATYYDEDRFARRKFSAK